MEDFDLRKYLVENKLLKEEVDISKISKLRDYNETEDFYKYGDYIVQKYDDGEKPYAVFKDRGEKTDSYGSPDFEFSDLKDVIDFLKDPIDTFLNINFNEVKEKIGNIPSKFKIMGDPKVATAADGERGIDISFDKKHMLSLFPKEDPFNKVETIEIAGKKVHYNDYL